MRGGLYPLSGATGTANEEYDPSTDTWTPRSPMPTARWNVGVGVLHDRIHAIGGANVTSGVLGTNQEYDPATDAWTSMLSMPTRRESLGVTTVGNSIYAIGGYSAGPSTPLIENEEFYLKAYYIHKKN